MRSHSRSASSRLCVASTIVRPALAERLDRLADDERRLRVERRGRFVEEHDRRVVEQRAGDGELLLHALAERARHVVAAIPQAEEAQVVLDALGAQRRRRGRAAGRRSRGSCVADSLSYRPGVSVRMPTRARTSSGCVADVEAVDRGRALGRLDQRGEQADGRRLAGAVGAEEPEHLAAADLEVDAADRPAIAEPPAQPGRRVSAGRSLGRGVADVTAESVADRSAATSWPTSVCQRRYHRPVIAVRFLVLALGAALGVFYPFIAVILQSFGFGPARSGSSPRSVRSASPSPCPAWGHLADVRLGRPRTLQVCAIGAALAIGAAAGRWPALVIAVLFMAFWVFESSWQPLADAVTVNAVARPGLRPGPVAHEPVVRASPRSSPGSSTT